MVCKKCGRELSDTAAFCPACGTPCSPQEKAPAGAASETEPKAPEYKSKRKIIIAVAAAAVVAVAVVGGIKIPSLFGNEADGKNVKQDDGGESAAIEESTESVQPEKNSDAVETTTEAIAYDELLANLEQANTAVVDSWTQIENGLDVEESISLLGELQQTLDSLRPEAVSLATGDGRLSDAVVSYYSLASDYAKIRYDYYDFFKRYNSAPFILARPNLFDDDRTPQENYDDMKNWLESAKAEYESFEYPLFVEGYWKEYENILDLNQTILHKYALAVNYNDNLRMASCEELYDRCVVAEEKWFNDVLDSSYDMLNLYCVSAYSYSVKLCGEIRSYSEMSGKDREEYVFENSMSDAICYDTECVDTIYPSLYNTYDSFAIISLAAYGEDRKIDVEVEIPGFTQKYRQSYTVTNEARQLFIKPPLVTGDIDLTSAKSAQLNITLYNEDGTQITTESHPITIKSKNDVEWVSSDFGTFTKDNILCFLTPESSSISALKRNAIDEIYELSDGKVESLAGYQMVAGNVYAVTYLQSAAIMKAMYNMGVRYNMDGFSVSGSNQHILLPEQVLEQQSGLCIETSLTVASALQSAGMHAFLVLPPGHAQVAVEIWDSGNGSGEYFLIETTALNDSIINGSGLADDAAALMNGELDKFKDNGCIYYFDSDAWKEYIQDAYVIDCDDSRVLGMTPFAN